MLLFRLSIVFAASSCVRAKRNQEEISVGFNLGISYGTAAIAYPNGTHVAVAKVGSSNEYRQTMLRLSEHPFHQLYRESRAHQQEHKRPGFPASDDARVIGALVKSLKEETEKLLCREVIAAAAAVPHFPALYDRHLYDAFKHAGLQYLEIMQRGNYDDGTFLTFETSAALAGHGLSLCTNTTDREACPRPPPDEHHNQDDIYYVIDYTDSSILAYHTIAISNDAYHITDYPAFNLNLSSDGRSREMELRHILLGPLQRMHYRVPTKAILVGNSIHDAWFRAALNETMESFFNSTKKTVPEVVESDAQFVQAKGVAEFARRRRLSPEAGSRATWNGPSGVISQQKVLMRDSYTEVTWS